ncbi:MAG TPA: hypothetical protein IGR64_01360 [Leptolyngbyaceae cyanobacterium M65_K2018_010]|nr:hypothetical protein [Leptolyngbyaceae cyanobacterium M65_K2018_010]
MPNPNQRLMRNLGLGWLAFLGLGLGLRHWLMPPTITVIIDRSYCAPSQWQPLAAAYADLYEQQTQQRLKIDQVIYVSDLGQEVAPTPPTPDEVRQLSTFGRFNPAQMERAKQAQPGARVLSCQGGPP